MASDFAQLYKMKWDVASALTCVSAIETGVQTKVERALPRAFRFHNKASVRGERRTHAPPHLERIPQPKLYASFNCTPRSPLSDTVAGDAIADSPPCLLCARLCKQDYLF
jgi:hypothetical protein